MIIGICGGSGSGKTTVARNLVEVLGRDRTVLLAQDSYYKDNNILPIEERAKINFDHPESVDFDLLVEHLNTLKLNRPIDCPRYDFNQHLRSATTFRLEPKPVIVLEGILIYYDPRLRDLFDLKVYVDTDADIRFIRRLKRDVRERGRSIESVIEQYLHSVRSMHQEFVEPGKKLADIVLLEGGKNPRNIDLLVEWVRAHAA